MTDTLNIIDVNGLVPYHGTLTLTRRVLGNDGAAITQASLSTITYTIYLLDINDPSVRTVVTNHSGVSVTIGTSVFDTLQKDVYWNDASGNQADGIGYNFRHQPASIRTAVYAFATVGATFLVEYTLTPSSGEAILLRFKLKVV